MKKTRIGIAILASASLALAACTTTDEEVVDPADGAAATATADTTTEDTTDEDVAADPAGNNEDDVEFAQMMIPHHEQGVELSDIILAKDGVDPRVQDLAQRIRDAQFQEAEQMRSWLDAWGAPQPEDTDMDHSDMDGMLNPEEVAEVEAADTPEAQELFLDHMISHHEGAVDMAETHRDNGQNEDALALSEQIVRTQEAEIAEMEEVRDSL